MIELVPLDRHRLDVLRGLASTEPLISALGATAEMYERTGQEAPWLSYLVAIEESGVIAGICSFTGPPEDGTAEISYFTFPDFEGRGIGTLMASALVEIACSTPQVDRIAAHTLAKENASTRILARLGFTRNGKAVDPEAGEVWAWVLHCRN